MPNSAPPAILIVIPVYNHAATLPAVVRGALAAHPHVLVVDDGSTDIPAEATARPQAEGEPFVPGPGHPLFGLPVTCLRHRTNRGKGAAIMSGAAEAERRGLSHILTLDADGQHDPADIPAFLDAAREDPLAVYVGLRDFSGPNVPFASRFGRAFSNFWYKVQTGEVIGDMQSGFRLYPLAVLEAARCAETGYSFEVEALVRAAWAGFAVRDIPVRVHYPPKAERVSHFRPLRDNWRISLLNTRLTIRAIMPLPQRHYVQDGRGGVALLRPLQSLRLLLSRDETPKSLALGAAVGMGLGTLPLIGLHSIAILLTTGALRLNKIAGLSVSQLCMPPLVPALCVEAGYYLRHGRFLTDISLQTLGYEALERLWEWLLGSLLLAPLLAALCGGLVWVLARLAAHSLRREGPLPASGAGEARP
jgi:glycosyltransferase involved in cell wall biosynthesis/uncharacterized protein (DUF2062 family)